MKKQFEDLKVGDYIAFYGKGNRIAEKLKIHKISKKFGVQCFYLGQMYGIRLQKQDYSNEGSSYTYSFVEYF